MNWKSFFIGFFCCSCLAFGLSSYVISDYDHRLDGNFDLSMKLFDANMKYDDLVEKNNELINKYNELVIKYNECNSHALKLF